MAGSRHSSVEKNADAASSVVSNNLVKEEQKPQSVESASHQVVIKQLEPVKTEVEVPDKLNEHELMQRKIAELKRQI